MRVLSPGKGLLMGRLSGEDFSRNPGEGGYLRIVTNSRVIHV